MRYLGRSGALDCSLAAWLLRWLWGIAVRSMFLLLRVSRHLSVENRDRSRRLSKVAATVPPHCRASVWPPRGDRTKFLGIGPPRSYERRNRDLAPGANRFNGVTARHRWRVACFGGTGPYWARAIPLENAINSPG